MADLIFYNGVVHTMDGETASAVAVSGPLIQAVGKDEDILKLAGKGCQTIDLKGACVTPGFNDSHCHLLTTGIQMRKLNLRGAKSLEEVIERGRAYIAKYQIPDGAWVCGVGYDQNRFPEPVLPDRKVADAISVRHPVLLERICGHVGTVNTMAMELAGYTEDTKIPGGELEKDGNGHLTGVLKESALDRVGALIPRLGEEEAKAVIREVAKRYNACGITSAHTDDLGEVDMDTMLAVYRQLEQEGQLNLRIFEEVRAPRLPELKHVLGYGLRTGDGTDYFRIGNIKLFVDGSLGARTAFMTEDYADDPGNRGIPVYTQEELDQVVMAAHQAGMQVACHAIGDGAVELCINAFEKAEKSDGRHLRDRVVHCQFAGDRMLARMAELGIGSDIQPSFAVSDGPMVYSRLGDREWCGYRWKTMLDQGIKMGGGSDSPVDPFDVIWGIHCAVNRTDALGNPAGVFHPEERLTPEEALKLYTTGGAYLSFDENRKGKIKENYLADLAVLSQDILNIPPEEIRGTKVLMTVVGGRIVYQYEPRG